jgi:hypothetical protein
MLSKLLPQSGLSEQSCYLLLANFSNWIGSSLRSRVGPPAYLPIALGGIWEYAF